MPRKSQPATRTARISARITARTEEQMKDLARLWGGIRPLTAAAVAEEAIDRAWRAEMAREERK
jgi:hypothetical protein